MEKKNLYSSWPKASEFLAKIVCWLMQIQQIYEIIPGICNIMPEIFDLLDPLNNKKSSELFGLYYIRTN